MNGGEWSERTFDPCSDLRIWCRNMKKSGNLFLYFTQGVAATEVEVDMLTGDHTVRRVDIHVSLTRSLYMSKVTERMVSLLDGRGEIPQSCY